MARKKKVVADITDIDVTLLPFQSRTTLGQYVLEAMEQRVKDSKDLREHFPCQITLSIHELHYDNRLVV